MISHRLLITHLNVLNMVNFLEGFVKLFDLPVLIMHLDEVIVLKRCSFRQQVNHEVAILVF